MILRRVPHASSFTHATHTIKINHLLLADVEAVKHRRVKETQWLPGSESMERREKSLSVSLSAVHKGCTFLTPGPLYRKAGL